MALISLEPDTPGARFPLQGWETRTGKTVEMSPVWHDATVENDALTTTFRIEMCIPT